MHSIGDHSASILAGDFQNVLWIRIEAKGSFQNSPSLKEFADGMIGRGQNRIVIDLKNCPVMDSTFMGTITGIALKLKTVADGHLQIINANDRNRQLLQSLGLDQILDLDVEGSAWKEERRLVDDNILNAIDDESLDKEEHAEFVLEAHEALCRANNDNVRRFKDVIEYLKNDLEEHKSA